MNAPRVFLVTGDDCLCGHIRVFSLLTLGVVVSPALCGADDHRTSNALDGDHKGTGDHSFPRASLRATCLGFTSCFIEKVNFPSYCGKIVEKRKIN